MQPKPCSKTIQTAKDAKWKAGFLAVYAFLGKGDILLFRTRMSPFPFPAHWQRQNSPDNTAEIEAVEQDAGRHLTYIRTIARRNPGIKLQPYCWPDASFSLPVQYERQGITGPNSK